MRYETICSETTGKRTPRPITHRRTQEPVMRGEAGRKTRSPSATPHVDARGDRL